MSEKSLNWKTRLKPGLWDKQKWVPGYVVIQKHITCVMEESCHLEQESHLLQNIAARVAQKLNRANWKRAEAEGPISRFLQL